jgi:hypothetical protein
LSFILASYKLQEEAKRGPAVRAEPRNYSKGAIKMNKVNGINIHIHLHEGIGPEAVKTAVEAICAGLDEGSPRVGAVDTESPDQMAELVRRAYRDSKEKAKPLLEFLADNPARLIPYPEVSDHLGFETSRSLPGLLGAFSRRADHRYGGVQPFERRETPDGWCLYMPREVAEIINGLRNN